MSLSSQCVDESWPPGTVRIEDLKQPSKEEIILQPRPSKDPNDPLNWPLWRKYVNFALVSFYVLAVFALLNTATVTWVAMNETIGFSYGIMLDSYAVGCGALCIGGLVLLPFALKYGRRPVYILSLLVQTGISIWTARIQTVADLMLVNILCCFVGALCEVMVQMTVADVFFVHQRGLMNSIYVWMLTIGASLAPLAAGYVTVSEGWRWVWWWIAIILGLASILFIFFYEESMYDRDTINGVHEPDPSAEKPMSLKGQDLEQRPSNLKEASHGVVFQPEPPLTKVTIDATIPVKTYRQRLSLWTSSPIPLKFYTRHCYRPFQVLANIPAVLYIGVLNGMTTSAVIIPITTLSTYMTLPPYNFNSQQIGLMGLPGFLGTLISALLTGPLMDWAILRMAKRNNGIYEPEMRLWFILVFSPFAIAGLLMFGIGLNNGLPWPFLAVGSALSAFGSTPANSASLTYITDAYTEIISDSLVGVTFVKNLFPTILVFALTPWVDGQGLTRVFVVFTVLYAVTLVGSIVPIMIGKRLRARTAAKYLQYAGHDLDKPRERLGGQAPSNQ